MRGKKTVLLPREFEVPSADYKPTNAELKEEFDMPGADMEAICRGLFRPATIVWRRPKR